MCAGPAVWKLVCRVEVRGGTLDGGLALLPGVLCLPFFISGLPYRSLDIRHFKSLAGSCLYLLSKPRLQLPLHEIVLQILLLVGMFLLPSSLSPCLTLYSFLSLPASPSLFQRFGGVGTQHGKKTRRSPNLAHHTWYDLDSFSLILYFKVWSLDFNLLALLTLLRRTLMY